MRLCLQADNPPAVCRMCLFLQSQDFQRHTEHIINMLFSSAQHAAEQLTAVDARLAQSLATMHGMDAALTDVAASQKEQLLVAAESLEGVRLLHNDSQAVHYQLQHALENGVSNLL